MRELSTQVVVFTDLVGSTVQRAAVGDDAADALLRRHDELVHAVVGGRHGRVVKSLGDGVMACFPSAADAVDAAVALQQALAREAAGTAAGPQLHLRIGISAGDVQEVGLDLLGTPVVEAARLCAAASGDEILVAELARLLARGRTSAAFEPLGVL
jgi:class 3 adenylate cyclase